MVLVGDVEFYSLCEHHMLPFFGKISVAYLPGDKIIGLSKIPRLVDVFARRLQVQERMTVQLAETLQEFLQPRGVAVIATGFHLCMAMRGVEKQGSATTTTAFRGEFEGNQNRREEFLRLVQLNGEGSWIRRSS
jgi:GTP cyclohydrolase I